MEALSFFTLFDNFDFFTDNKYLSNPPLKSTVLKAALVTLSLMFFF